MARIKIELPTSFIFRAEIITRITDLNYGGHVGNDKIFGYMHDARVQFLNNLGYKNELDFDGYGTIQTDAAIVYKEEIFSGEKITIHIGLMDFNKYGMDMVYQFEKSNGSVAAIGKTGLVFFNYQSRKIAEIPKDFLEKIGQ
jgi:acyl-CoA thioester hydrolase